MPSTTPPSHTPSEHPDHSLSPAAPHPLPFHHPHNPPPSSSCQAKNAALRAAGAVVPDSFEGLEGVIRSTYERLVAEGVLTPTPDVEVPEIPVDLATAVKQGKVRGGGAAKGDGNGACGVWNRDQLKGRGMQQRMRGHTRGGGCRFLGQGRAGASAGKEERWKGWAGWLSTSLQAAGVPWIDSGRRGGRQAQWFILLA